LVEDIRKALKLKEGLILEQLKELLPLEVRDISPLFSKGEADKLAPYYLGVDY